ncbi:MAG: ferritin-like domain-containing protein [Planctomycetales bacterium]
MPSSLEWRLHFEHNALTLLEIPWQFGEELTAAEKSAIGRSLAEFQAGESSEGKHLHRFAREYAERTGDHEYLVAIRVFIAEEQRHGRDLGRFLTLNGIPLVRTTFADRVFRKLRRFLGGLESSIAVLIVAEIIAKVYYAAIRDATESRVLRRLCEQILQDEEAHVRFQAEQLATLRRGRGRIAHVLTMAAQRFLFDGTVLVVWWAHRRAVRKGGLSFARWWRGCRREFVVAFPRRSARPVTLVARPSADAARSAPEAAAERA